MAKTKAFKPLTGKKLDALISTLYHRTCSGIQINIMDIPKVFKVAVASYAHHVDGTQFVEHTPVTVENREQLLRELVAHDIVAYVQTIRQN